MTGDAENELSGAPELPPHDLAAEQAGEAGEVSPPTPAGEPPLRRKAFANWGAAKREAEPEASPSLFKRASQRLKAMFGGEEPRSQSPSQPEPEPETDFASDLPLLADHREEPAAAESYAEPALELSGAAPPDEIELTPSAPPEPELVGSVPEEPVAAEEPKEDLAFLRSGSFDAIDEPEPEPTPAKKPGFLGRLFSSRTQPAAPEAQALEALEAPLTEPSVGAEPAALEAQPAEVTSLDEALPMDESPVVPIEELTVPDEPAPAPEPTKRGFFARLLNRAREREAQAMPEPVADVAAETTGSLDAADSAFATASDDFAPPPATDAGFATVDDALPALEAEPVEEAPVMDARPTLESTQPIDVDEVTDAAQPIDLSHTAGGTPIGAEAAASYHAMPVYDFDTPKPDDRSTMEVDMPAADPVDSRPTAELTPALEMTLAEHADEEKRDTDEIELVDLAQTIAEDPEKTAEVAREPGFFKKLFSRTKEVTQVEAAVMPPPTANPHFLVTKFRTFYNEVVIYKNQKTDLTAGFATAIVTSYDADLSPEQAAQSLSQRLHQMLELQLAEASWMGGEAHDLYPEAQYAMACLADEMLTHMEWPGQAAWGAHHLELKLFKSAASDVEFFKRVDKLLKNGPQTVGTRDLARVYLLAIASGFRGKYRPFDLHRPLAEYRRRLYEFVYGGDALLLYSDDRRIFPEAVSVTVAGKGVKRFSMAQQWAAILILLLAGYTFIAHLAWTRVSADLKDIAGRVEQARTSTTNTADSPNGGGGQ